MDKSGTLKGSAGTTSTSGDDTFEATPTTLTALDNLNGGDGSDMLSIIDVAGASASFAGTTVAGIEEINLTSTSGLASGALDTTAGNITGLKVLNVNLSAPTAHQSITAGEEAVTLTVQSQATSNLTVAGGSDVTVSALLQTTGTITVGSTLQPATGAVNVSASGNYSGADVALGAISVTGGTSVVVSQTSGITAAESNAALTEGTNHTVTQSAVTVTGTAGTTSVTVNQSAAQDLLPGSADPTSLDYLGGQIGIVNGDVTVNDANRLSSTKVGSISEVTLNSFGAATINSGALTTLNLSGTGVSVDASTSGALLTPTATSMTINLTKAAITGAVTLDADVTSVSINSSTTKSSIGTLAIPGAVSLTVSGNAGVTISSLSGSNITSVTNAGTSDLTISSTLATSVLYVGGAGKDSISLGATTKAINTAGGNDTVTVSSAFGTGGSVDAGEGTDTLRGTQADLASLSATNAFESKVTGFERLTVTSASGTSTIDLANLDEINYVTVSGASTGSTTFANATSGFVLNLGTTNNSNTVTLNNNGSSDSITVNASDLTAGITTYGEDTAFGTIVATGFENVTLNVNGVSLLTGKALTHSMTVTDTTLKNLTVTGEAALTLTHTGTALSNLDASSQTGGLSLTTGDLAGDDAGKAVLTGGAGADTINAAAANGTLLTSVTISGGAGKDTLTGSATKANTLNGGAGNDSLTGGAKADTIDGGEGTDTFTFSSAAIVDQDGVSSTDGVVINLSDAAVSQSTVYTAVGKYLSAAGASVAAGTATYLYGGESSTNAVVVDTLTSVENATGTEGVDYIVGSAGNNALLGGDGVDYITAGAGDDYLSGSAGDDIDTLIGGTGNDTYAIADSTGVDVYIETATGGSDTIFFTGDFTLAADEVGASIATKAADGALSNFEQIVLFSQSGANQVAGASGADATFSAAQVTGRTLLIGESVSTEVTTTSITVDGSGASAAQTIDLSGFTFATAGRTYTNASGATAIMQNLTSGTDLIKILGGSDVDTIKGTSYGDIITAGAGVDSIDISGGGADTVVISSPLTANRDSVTGFSTSNDVIGLVEAEFSAINFGNTAAGTATGTALNASDYNEIAAGGTIVANKVNVITTAAGYADYTAAIAAVTAAADGADAFIMFYNSTSGKTELYWDADADATASGILIASLDITGANVVNLSNANFAVFG